jgi:hypothetical protein
VIVPERWVVVSEERAVVASKEEGSMVVSAKRMMVVVEIEEGNWLVRVQEIYLMREKVELVVLDQAFFVMENPLDNHV